MSVYDKNGNLLVDIYDKNGISLGSAFDKDGNVVFAKNPLNLKVMTFNVGQWWKGGGGGTSDESIGSNYRALFNKIFTDQDVDFVCIQEYWEIIGQQTAKALLEQYFPYVIEVCPTGANYFKHAVASKYPISNFVTAPLAKNPTFKPVEENTNTNRFIDRCNITIDNKVFTVFNTHFGLNTTDRAKNAEWLIGVMQGYTNIIACGDYNLHCHNDTHADYTDVIEVFLGSGYHCANCTDFGFINTYTADTGKTATMDNGHPCDNIVTSRNIMIDDVWADESKLTDNIGDKIDHIPLIAELTVY